MKRIERQRIRKGRFELSSKSIRKFGKILPDFRIYEKLVPCTPASPRTGLREGNLARHGLRECKSQLSVRFRKPIYYHFVRIAM